MTATTDSSPKPVASRNEPVASAPSGPMTRAHHAAGTRGTHTWRMTTAVSTTLTTDAACVRIRG